MDIIQFINKLKSLVDFSKEKTDEIMMNELKPEIEDMNTFQLSKGMYSTGTFLDNYSEVSVVMYGKPDGPIRLYDTGEFYRSIELQKINKNVFELFSNPSISEKYLDPPANLKQMYGPDVLGLTNKNEEITGEELTDLLRNEIEKYLG